jgi:radical SAM protein with 4Fe4S-binding SPASM domain
MLNEMTKENLRRKSHYIDTVEILDNTPLFSWIDINPTELCNRKCVFCPRVDDEKYPNQRLHMDLTLANKIANELKGLNYKGVIVFSGFGEPMMHPQFVELVKIFKGICRLEIVTNGDYLRGTKIKELYEAGLDYFVVSMYDGPEQKEEFIKKFSDANLTNEHYILRDRWHTEEDSFGLKLTNRAGTIQVGDQAPVDIKHPCYYTAYSLTIDWNGDVLLCMQDWNKKIKFGNLNTQTLVQVWNSKHTNDFRKKLLNGNRSCAPCNNCNTDGTLHGHNHVKVWHSVLNK